MKDEGSKMRRKIALEKLLAVTTGSLLIMGGAALASAAASDGPADSTDTGVELSDPPVVSAIDDVVVGDDQGENEDADETEVEDDDQGNLSDDDQADASDDQGSED